MQVQKAILSRLELLQAMVFENAKDEISPVAMKRYEKISLGLDAGKGKKLSSISGFKSYLKNL